MERSLSQTQELLRSMLPDLAQRYGVVKLWIFGSAAREEAKPNSDLDVLVEFSSREFSLLDFIALEQDLSEKLGVKVDLVDRAALRKELEPHVLPEAKAV